MKSDINWMFLLLCQMQNEKPIHDLSGNLNAEVYSSFEM